MRVQAQYILLKPRELGEPERESAVVAEVAQIAKMVGDALALETKGTQARRARRNGDPGDRLGRLRVGPRVGDGAVAGNAPGESVALCQRECFEALLDSLVDVAKPFLEPQDFLADNLEPEVSRLDDAGVDRSDRDLVHAVAADAHERVILLARLPFR